MITRRLLVSLNTAAIKIRGKHPRLYSDLKQLLQELIKMKEKK